MSEQKQPDGPLTHRDGPSGQAARKPYVKPSFQREQVFETMALACGKVNPTSGACKAVRKNS